MVFVFFCFFLKKIETINDKIDIIKMLNNNNNNDEFNIALEDLKTVSNNVFQKIKETLIEKENNIKALLLVNEKLTVNCSYYRKNLFELTRKNFDDWFSDLLKESFNFLLQQIQESILPQNPIFIHLTNHVKTWIINHLANVIKKYVLFISFFLDHLRSLYIIRFSEILIYNLIILFIIITYVNCLFDKNIIFIIL